MEKYLVIKKNEILFFAGKWMALENILSEVNQVQKDKGHMFSFLCGKERSKYKCKYYNICV
jgi:hypothetical protein